MDRARLDQLEECGLRFEVSSVGALHIEASCHRAKWGRQRAARGVFEGLAGSEGRLLSDDARAVNLFGMTGTVDDRPMAIEQLDGRVTFVGDANRIEEEPSACLGVAVFGRILCANPNAYASGFSFRRCFGKIALGHG